MISQIDANKTTVMAALIGRYFGRVNSVLVVGCGSGQEAGILASLLDCKVLGVDISGDLFDRQAAYPATLSVMDAQQLDVPNASFDFVYSFHALEHIPDPVKALAEMRRALRPRGGYLIGTPNKTRLVGYINSSASISDRIRWNAHDYRLRFTCHWANGDGAHAGFTGNELVSLCRANFGSSTDVSQEYYALTYPSNERLLTVLHRTRLHRIVYPCVYVTGVKAAG